MACCRTARIADCIRVNVYLFCWLIVVVVLHSPSSALLRCYLMRCRRNKISYIIHDVPSEWTKVFHTARSVKPLPRVLMISSGYT